MSAPSGHQLTTECPNGCWPVIFLSNPLLCTDKPAGITHITAISFRPHTSVQHCYILYTLHYKKGSQDNHPAQIGKECTIATNTYVLDGQYVYFRISLEKEHWIKVSQTN
jgi:hypothetical protein